MIALRYILASFVVLLLEGTVVNRIAVGGARPDLGLALVVYAGLFHRVRGGVLVGLLIGLLRGCAEPEWMGLEALLLSLVGFVAGVASTTVNRGHPLVQALLLALLLGAHDLVRAFVVTSASLPRALGFWWHSAPPAAVYTAFLAPLAVWLLPRLWPGRSRHVHA